MLTALVVSVSTTLVYDTDASSRRCLGGQEMSEGGGLTVSDAVTCPFLPEANVPVAITGPDTVVLFWALGLAPGPDEVRGLRERLLGNEGNGHEDQRHHCDPSLHLPTPPVVMLQPVVDGAGRGHVGVGGRR
jgi:hypothetical protein